MILSRIIYLRISDNSSAYATWLIYDNIIIIVFISILLSIHCMFRRFVINYLS